MASAHSGFRPFTASWGRFARSVQAAAANPNWSADRGSACPYSQMLRQGAAARAEAEVLTDHAERP